MDATVGFRITVTSFVTSLYFTASFGAVLHLSCPQTFSLTAENNITCQINISGLNAANCAFADTLDFLVQRKVSKTPVSITGSGCTYPPPSCGNPVAANKCGCLITQNGFHVYTLQFSADESHTGGQLSTSLCLTPSGPFDVTVDASCKDIKFAHSQSQTSRRIQTDDPGPISGYTLAGVIASAAIILVILCCCFNRRCRRLSSCCSSLPTKACGCFLCCMACWNCWCNKKFCKSNCNCCAKRCRCCHTPVETDILQGASRTCIGCDVCCCCLSEDEVEELIKIKVNNRPDHEPPTNHRPDHEPRNANPKDDINSSKKKKGKEKVELKDRP